MGALPIGADVERIEPDAHRPLDLLHPALSGRLGTADAAEFTEAWTALEAHLKRTGEGLSGLTKAQVQGAQAWSAAGVSEVSLQRRGSWAFACATPAMETP